MEQRAEVYQNAPLVSLNSEERKSPLLLGFLPFDRYVNDVLFHTSRREEINMSPCAM